MIIIVTDPQGLEHRVLRHKGEWTGHENISRDPAWRLRMLSYASAHETGRIDGPGGTYVWRRE